MFNIAIFKQSVRKNYPLWLLITGIVCFFACMVAYLAKVNPRLNLPGSPGGTDLITIYVGAFYDIMGLMLILVYAIATGIRLVVTEVDRGDLSYTLNTPVNRREVILTKVGFYVASLLAMILVLSFVGSAANALISPGKLDYGTFWGINAVMFCFMFAISGISFVASCWFNKTSSALTIGVGIPVVFFLFNVIAGFGSDFEFFKYFTLNTLFNPTDIIAGNNIIADVVTLLGVGLVLYVTGIMRFLKKDLPL